MTTESIRTAEDLARIKKAYLGKKQSYRREVLVCGGAGCISSNSREVVDALTQAVSDGGLGEEVLITQTGCMGMCALGPVMLVLPDNIFYVSLDAKKARDVVERHLAKNEVCEELQRRRRRPRRVHGPLRARGRPAQSCSRP
jgi:NADH-quinone oxidoreductase subunit F